jgi:hypothetical protein
LRFDLPRPVSLLHGKTQGKIIAEARKGEKRAKKSFIITALHRFSLRLWQGKHLPCQGVRQGTGREKRQTGMPHDAI